MPIMSRKPNTTVPHRPNDKPIPTAPVIKDDHIKDVYVDSTYKPASSLLTYVSGSPWTIDSYYSQVVDENSMIQGQSINKAGAYQQYNKILNMVINVQSPFSPTQDVSTKEFTQTGSALIYPHFIPLEGDMFVADNDDGQFGIYQVINSERKSLLNDSVHLIEYQLISIGNKERILDLDNKVINEFVFVKEFLQTNRNPLITKKEFDYGKEIYSQFRFLINYYLDMFLNSELYTILVPDNKESTYDPIISNIFKSCVSVTDNSKLLGVRLLNHNDILSFYSHNVMTALFNRESRYISVGWKRVGLTSVATFNNRPQLITLHYSGVNYLVYPTDIDHYEKVGLLYAEKSIEHTYSRDIELLDNHPLVCNKIDNYSVTPSIYAITVDDYYIFSEAFYKRIPGKMSKIETLVYDYIDKKEIDFSVLHNLIIDCTQWPLLEKFYYIPILMLIAKNTLGSF